MGKNRPASGQVFAILCSMKAGDKVNLNTVQSLAKEKGITFTNAQVTSFISKLARDKSLVKTSEYGTYIIRPRLFGYGRRHPFRAQYDAQKPRPRGPRKFGNKATTVGDVDVIDALLDVMAKAEPILKKCKDNMLELELTKTQFAAQTGVVARQGKELKELKEKMAKLKNLL